MTTQTTRVVRPAVLWVGAALAVPAAFGTGAGWQLDASAVLVAAALLGVPIAVAALVPNPAAAPAQLALGGFAVVVVVAGVWVSGILASLLPAVAGALGCALLAWILHRSGLADPDATARY